MSLIVRQLVVTMIYTHENEEPVDCHLDITGIPDPSKV